MGRLIYSAMHSFDGYVLGAPGRFDRAEPDETAQTTTATIFEEPQ